MSAAKLKIGDTIDMLTIVDCRRVKLPKDSHIIWICDCICGGRRECKTNIIRMPRRGLLSCGCTDKKQPDGQPRGRKIVDPTPDEIYLRCLEIREGWSEEEAARRTCRKLVSWEVPRARQSSCHNKTNEFS